MLTHILQAQSNNDLDTLYRQNSVNINLLTNSMDTVMANLPKISLLESPTVENSDSERLDVVMVSCIGRILIIVLPNN